MEKVLLLFLLLFNSLAAFHPGIQTAIFLGPQVIEMKMFRKWVKMYLINKEGLGVADPIKQHFRFEFGREKQSVGECWMTLE
ncbi:hypothetical protein XELAEV_18042634mg [Xenopus laevis]|uniref:Uncharacterized protein n=1 Tax=Xenopus laevis TaxID=8355 RepID=A0A974H687_XENLA|nr:hypothetical protein XELAEV_18042634mg [Xenopus laevis]